MRVCVDCINCIVTDGYNVWVQVGLCVGVWIYIVCVRVCVCVCALKSSKPLQFKNV